MKAGDVLLFHRPTSWGTLRADFVGTLFTAAIHFCTRSRWNHAAMAISPTEYVEATGAGVVVTEWGRTTDEVTVCPVWYTDPDDLMDTLGWATARVGTKYGYLNAVVCGLRNMLPGLQIKDGGTVICSELVAEALRQSGRYLGKDAALVSPGDLADYFHVPR